jgi:hypothetical protein
LEAVVSDGRSGLQACFKIAWLDEVPLALGVVPPDPGETIGLQLHAHGQDIPLSLRGLVSEARHLLCNAHVILHVMADLMSDHIGLRKVAGRAEPSRHGIEK